MDIQARVPDALCALHNFIHRFDSNIFDEEADDLLEYESEEGGGELNELGDGPADAAERRRADNCCDDIARQMWEAYVAVRAARGNPVQ